MTKHIRFLLPLILLSGFNARAYSVMSLPGSLFSLSSEPKKGLAGKSELGLSFLQGNINTNQTLLAQELSYRWTDETLQLLAEYFEQSTAGILKGQRWRGSLRYERRVVFRLGAFAGETLEGNPFLGYQQRYSTDLGARYHLWKDDKTRGAMEAGYRYQIENRTNGIQSDHSVGRLFLESSYTWDENANALFGIEYLPVLSNLADWRMNAELGLSLRLTSVLALKLTNGYRYANIPSGTAVTRLDRLFLTSLLASF
jgi:putative salt-induced outer membrane protein YdiY